MKHISKIGMMALAGGMFAIASCSDFNDYNTVPGAYEATADKTLWENISGNANLSDFAAVLQRVGYDKVLDASHTYTVWAPVNGSFNVDSLASLSDEKVRTGFVENLIADYAHKESDVNDTTIYMLNEKLLKFANKGTNSLTFDANSVLKNVNDASVYNYPSNNGLLYTVSSPATFRYNGYEIISEMSGVASQFAARIKRFERNLLDVEASVKGEIINGVQHYDDSVIVVRNALFSRNNALVSNEDSLYTVLIMNDDAWTSTYNKISKYYNYIPELNYQDLATSTYTTKGGSTTSTSATIENPTTAKATYTLDSAPSDAEIQETGAYWTDSITKEILTNNVVFSETNGRYNRKLLTGESFVEDDTLYSTTKNRMAAMNKLDEATVQTIRLSNGHARLLNAYPFEAKTYLPEINTLEYGRFLSASGTGLVRTTKNKSLIAESVWTPQKKNETSLTVLRTQVPSTSNYAPEIDFYIPGVRSATYDVYVVMVPAGVISDDPVGENGRLPYSLRVDINYTDASNTQIAGRFDGTGIKTSAADIKRVGAFIVNCKNEDGSPRVDTLSVGRVTFPVCYAGTGVSPNIKIMHTNNTFMSSTKKKYEQNLRIAAVILKPVYDEENATKED